MKLEIRDTVKLFRYSDDNGNVINIFIEPTGTNEGRIIVDTFGGIYKRYFNGAGGGIYHFLSNMNLETLVYSGFDVPSHKEKRLIKELSPIWTNFTQEMKKQAKA